jgi:hypothetical protein
MSILLQDLHHGSRKLAGNPGFTAVAVVPLALRNAANTVHFSVVDAFCLRSLPVSSCTCDADRTAVMAVRKPPRFPWQVEFIHEVADPSPVLGDALSLHFARSLDLLHTLAAGTG